MTVNFLRLLLLSACLVSISLAETGSALNAGLQPVFHYSALATEPVIEYNLVQRMLAEPDAEPLLRVYGNGRVHVHIPAYMKRAGDYERIMSPAELNDLLRLLADDGIMDFNHASVVQEKQQLAAARRAATGEMFYISDATDTVINIRLNQYQRSPSSPRINNFSKQFVWRNLEHDARRYPASTGIARAASAAATLNALCAHPGLQKLP